MNLWFCGEVDCFSVSIKKNKKTQIWFDAIWIMGIVWLSIENKCVFWSRYAYEHHLGQTTAYVLHLLQGYLNNGHSVYPDNYYNSVALSDELTRCSTHIRGILKCDRKEIPKSIVKKKLKKAWLRMETKRIIDRL
jgi:hypothetical protein